uniref:Histone acetyltransferase n=1 Tax=Elaeis guineensis var. tenera TaxID=51953 RepID=A0A8N4F4L9_ELAGV|nr:putative MYST-like histone acetyltransferase 1 [Elaeis guineensis]
MDPPKDRNDRRKRKATAGGNAASSTSGPSVTLPLKVGTLLKCRWKDGTLHPAEIIERRQTPSGDPHGYEYYVHYTEFDRRLDQWVNLEQLDLNSKDTDVYAEAQKMMTRHQKRKMKASKEGYERFDAASLQEHQALTKVKNIEKIVLGRYEIETWYFSPLPSEYKNSKKLYFCEFCLNILETKEQLQRHMRKCDLKYPPGDEIYRSGVLSLFELFPDRKVFNRLMAGRTKVTQQISAFWQNFFLITRQYPVRLLPFCFTFFANVMIEVATWLHIFLRKNTQKIPTICPAFSPFLHTSKKAMESFLLHFPTNFQRGRV